MVEDEITEKVNTSEELGAGDKFETTPVIERARQERERLEAATKAQKIENDRSEAIMAKRQLGGDSTAGEEAEIPKEETPQDYAKKAIKGELNG